MTEEKIIDGRSIFPNTDGSEADFSVSRNRKLMEDLLAAMDTLDVNPSECILEVIDMGFVAMGSPPNCEWAFVTEFRIKPIETGFRSLVNFLSFIEPKCEVTNK